MDQNKQGVDIVTKSIDVVCLAAAFIVDDDRAWAMFKDYLDNMPGSPEALGDNARRALDSAIWRVDVMRRGIKLNYGLEPGDEYPRKYK